MATRLHAGRVATEHRGSRCASIAAGLLIAGLALAPPARANVSAVSGDAAALQAAIDAASDGDILLLEPGVDTTGLTVTLAGKGLTLVADGAPFAFTRLVIRDVPPASQVTLRGLQLQGAFAFFGFAPETGALEVLQCAGSVRIEACTLVAPPQMPGFLGVTQPGIHGLLAVDSPDVAASDCTLTGGRGAPEAVSCGAIGYSPAGVGGDGLRARESRVALLRCTTTGGTGGEKGSVCSQGSSKLGGAGLQLAGAARVHIAGGSVSGGADTPDAGGPGPGLVVDGPLGSVTRRDVLVLAGAGLPAQPDVVAPAGTVTTFPAVARGLAVPSPLRVNQPALLEIQGVAGDLVALFQAPGGAWVEQPGKQGVLLLGPPVLGPVFAAVLPSGSLAVPFLTPAVLPPGVDGLTVQLQLLVKQGAQVLVEDVASCTVLGLGVP
jgi:hypothetical protein